MLTETGTVVAVEPDGLWVETLKQSTCGQCQARHGCGQKLLLKGQSEMNYVKALFLGNELDHIWREGQQVLIGIEERALLDATFLAYLLPLFGMMAAMLLAHYLLGSELAVALGALLGLGAGGLFVRAYANKIYTEKASCFQVKVISPVFASEQAHASQ